MKTEITESQEPSVNLGWKMSQQLMYNNAIAVFGVVPIFAYMTVAYKNGRLDIVEYCKRALIKFKEYQKLRQITENNRDFFNENVIVMENDINVFDIYLKDLGYYESYNQLKLKNELKQLVSFLDIGV